MSEVQVVWVLRYALNGGIRQCHATQIGDDGVAWVEWPGEFGPEPLRLMPGEWSHTLAQAQMRAREMAVEWLQRHEPARARVSAVVSDGAKIWEDPN